MMLAGMFLLLTTVDGTDTQIAQMLIGLAAFGGGGFTATMLLISYAYLFIPAGMKHLPLSILKLDRPILHFSISMNGVYANTRTAVGTESVLDK